MVDKRFVPTCFRYNIVYGYIKRTDARKNARLFTKHYYVVRINYIYANMNVAKLKISAFITHEN